MTDLSPQIRKSIFEEVSSTLGRHHLNHTHVIEILAMALVSVIQQCPNEDDAIITELNERVRHILQHMGTSAPRLQ